MQFLIKGGNLNKHNDTVKQTNICLFVLSFLQYRENTSTFMKYVNLSFRDLYRPSQFFLGIESVHDLDKFPTKI